MKILFANNYAYLRGGSEKVFFDEMKLLKSKGNSVDYLSVDDEGDVKEKYKSSNLIPSPNVVQRLFNLFWNNKSAKSLSSILSSSNKKYQILHMHNIYSRLSHSIIFIAKKYGLKTILTLHDMKYVCPHYTALNNGNLCSKCSQGRFYNAAINMCHKDSFIASLLVSLELYFLHNFGVLSKVDKFISPSKFLIEYFKDNGFPYEIHYVPNFLPDDEKPNSAIKFENEDDFYLYVGRLSYEKGILNLLKAFRNNNRKLRIVGSGPLQKEIESFIQTNKMSNRIMLTGHLDTKEVHRCLEKSKALIVPSEWYENAPIAILEALAYGKIIIASNIGGIPEMVHEGKNGFLFEAFNYDKIIASLVKFESLSFGEKSTMRSYSLHLSDTLFSQKNHYKRLMEVYHEY